MNRRAVFSTVALMLLVGGFTSLAAGQPVVGGEAPGFSLPTLAGETVALADFRGQNVVLHFGTGW